MLLFSADVGHAGFLVFKDVEGFPLHCGVLDFVVRKRGVKLLLLGSLRSAGTEAGLGEQRFSVVRFHAGAASKENDAADGEDENEVCVSYSRFHGCVLAAYGSQVESVSTAEVNVSFVCHKNVTFASRGLNGGRRRKRKELNKPRVAGVSSRSSKIHARENQYLYRSYEVCEYWCRFTFIEIISRLCCVVHLRIRNGTKERNTDTAAGASSAGAYGPIASRDLQHSPAERL